jgi:hypothetical protein
MPSKRVPDRPPASVVALMPATVANDALDRRVCPWCRLYFDTAADSESVFCSRACERRYRDVVREGGDRAE